MFDNYLRNRVKKEIAKREKWIRDRYRKDYYKFVGSLEKEISKRETFKRKMEVSGESDCPFQENSKKVCRGCRHYDEGAVKYRIPKLFKRKAKYMDFEDNFLFSLIAIFFTNLQDEDFYIMIESEQDGTISFPRCKLWY
jgi:tRNA(Ile)-lysidine synthase TilS/MesJ